MKLSGVRPSIHGPLIDPAGFGDRGWEGEEGKKHHERRMFDAVEKAHMLDPSGNVPIVFHASNVGGREYVKTEDGEKRLQKSTAVNRETGQMVPLEYERRFIPGSARSLEGEGKEHRVEDQIGSINEIEWDNKMTELATFNKQAQEVMGSAPLYFKGEAQNYTIKKDGFYDMQGNKVKFSDETKKINLVEKYNQMRKSDVFLENVGHNFNTAFHKAYKYGSEEQKRELKGLAKEYRENLKTIGGSKEKGISVMAPVQTYEFYQQAINGLQAITSGKNGGAPQLYQEIEKFSIEKAADTFGNLALKSYKEWKDNAPIIVIENLPEHLAFNDPETFRKVIEESRTAFVKKLQKKEGMNERKAKKIAEKQIGATWDIGHINTLKKRGFTDKDIIKATEYVTEDPTLVKHIHLDDNFGFSDAHMVPGQGNVPLQGIMEKLAKRTKLGEMTKIIEAGAFISQFKASPLPGALKALNSPIYSMKAGPTWNMVERISGNYNIGFGNSSPENHHSLYGAGFTTLPTELGGQVSGEFSRFSGSPMS